MKKIVLIGSFPVFVLDKKYIELEKKYGPNNYVVVCGHRSTEHYITRCGRKAMIPEINLVDDKKYIDEVKTYGVDDTQEWVSRVVKYVCENNVDEICIAEDYNKITPIFVGHETPQIVHMYWNDCEDDMMY